LHIPSLVTPNGDGKNDFFEILDLAFYPSHRLQIFDRWGKKVLETSSFQNDWCWQAGTHAMAEDGVYVYHLEVDGKRWSG
jgi:gliding motility-associated-like protein